MQRVKTREEISKQVFLNQSDIAKLLGISRPSAKRIYNYAKEIDNERDGKYVIEPTKVRITSVCKVIGQSLNTIQKLASN